MATTLSILNNVAYLKTYVIFNVLTKPTNIRVLEYIEQHPGCNTFRIYAEATPELSRARVPQVLRELIDIGVVTVEQRSLHRYATLNHEMIQQINDSIAKLYEQTDTSVGSLQGSRKYASPFESP